MPYRLALPSNRINGLSFGSGDEFLVLLRKARCEAHASPPKKLGGFEPFGVQVLDPFGFMGGSS